MRWIPMALGLGVAMFATLDEARAEPDGPADRIDSVCAGGIAAHIHSDSSVGRDGRVVRRTRVRTAQPAPGRHWDLAETAGQIAPEAAAALFAALDRAGFDSFVEPRLGPAPDYVGCSITRTQDGRTHRVSFRAPARANSPDHVREVEIRRVISELHRLARAATEPPAE